mgnify:CR=1 FL=1
MQFFVELMGDPSEFGWVALQTGIRSKNCAQKGVEKKQAIAYRVFKINQKKLQAC